MKANWHKADVIAAVHKKGTSLAALSRAAGLSSSTLANALERPWPKGEALSQMRLVFCRRRFGRKGITERGNWWKGGF